VDDEDLIIAARAGAEWAGPMLVSLYAPTLLGYARGTAGDLDQTAREMICEWAVERALAKIDLFDPTIGSFAAWARSQVRYAAADYRRDHHRLTSLEGTSPPEQVLEPREDLPEEVNTAVHDGLEALSDADQVIIGLRLFEELPSQAVATLLGVSDEAVRKRYSRALQRLGEQLNRDRRVTNQLRGGAR
jgi:RNA polymerase sigma factor (sigma-70 family)